MRSTRTNKMHEAPDRARQQRRKEAPTTQPFLRAAWRVATPAAAVAAGLVLAACGHDDASTADITATTVDLASFCDAALAVATPPEPDVDFETASETEIAHAAQTWAAEVMRPLVDEVVAAAPPEIAGDVEVLSEALDEVADTGDLAALEAADVGAAGDRFDAFGIGSCGWTAKVVTALDYAFAGLPARLDAGPTVLELTNDGDEPHELVLFRKNDGVTQNAEQLLALPDEQAFELVEFAAAAELTEPGGTQRTVADLAPGDYVAVCFLPVGGSEDSPPHFTEGMFAELTVEG